MEGGRNDDEALARATALIHQHGALEETVQRARQYGEAAYAAASGLPQSPSRDAMLGVVEFCIDRVS
jgi:octaprenyl-diphosphate synthase